MDGPYTLTLNGIFLVNLIRLLTFFSLSIVSLGASAVQINGLYNGSVTVPSQESADRDLAFQAALNQVLVRISGQQARIEEVIASKAFGAAQKYVLSFAYRENPDYKAYLDRLNDLEREEVDDLVDESDSLVSDGQVVETLITEANEYRESPVPDKFILDVVFAEAALKKRMRELELPLWGRSRPSLLVWVIKADQEGGRSVIGASEIVEQLPEMVQYSQVRGVPLYFPVADLTDLAILDVDGVWGLFSDSHIEASQRYSPDSVAIVRLHGARPLSADYEATEAMQWSADWQLFIGGETFFQEVVSESLEGVTKAFVDHMAYEVSSLYAVSADQDTSEVLIDVMGVDSFDDYIRVQTYLETLAPVSSIVMEKASKDTLSFRVQLRDTQDKFYQHVSLGRKLLKLDELHTSLSGEALLTMPRQKFVWQAPNQ